MTSGLRPLSDITSIVIHCADTPNGDQRYGAVDIDRWHHDNGWLRPRGYDARDEARGIDNHFTAIGYHYVIEVDGKVVPGRALEEVGAHCPARNLDSIGICLVGRDRFAVAQWEALRGLTIKLDAESMARTGPLSHSGHRDNLRPGDKPKTCPGFSVPDWLANGMRPLEGHICEPKEKTHG